MFICVDDILYILLLCSSTSYTSIERYIQINLTFILACIDNHFISHLFIFKFLFWKTWIMGICFWIFFYSSHLLQKISQEIIYIVLYLVFIHLPIYPLTLLRDFLFFFPYNCMMHHGVNKSVSTIDCTKISLLLGT